MISIKALLVAMLVFWVLSVRRQLVRDLRIAWLRLLGKRGQAGNIAWQEGSDRGLTAVYLADAANHGDLQALLPLGQLFEEADEPEHAAIVYDILEERTRDLSPFLSATAQERLDTLRAARFWDRDPLANLPELPARFRVQNENVVVNPSPAPKNDTVPAVEVQSDSHNVHDSGVTNSLQVTYRKLKEAGAPTMPLSQCLKDIREYSKDSPRAVQALDAIERSSTGVACLNGEREVDVLHTVWSRICSQHDSAVKDMLVSQLADSVDERGYTVCTNGRVSRVIDSLNVVDPLVVIKPRWATRKELLALAAKLRAENPDDEQFKRAVRDQARQEYVDSGLMAQKLLDLELDSWLDHI